MEVDGGGAAEKASNRKRLKGLTEKYCLRVSPSNPRKGTLSGKTCETCAGRQLE